MRSFILNENEMNELAKRQPTPFLVLSVDKVAENYAFLRKHLPRAGIYYAIKANPHPRALERLAALGSHFDVASAGEMEMLHAAGVDGSRMIYANPVHDARGFAAASRFGVKRFTFDDESEIPKLAAVAPGADVLVRVQVHNSKALVDLNTKFGAPLGSALPLLRKAEQAGLHAKGICFHVGSQSLSTAAYEEALLLVHHLFLEAEASGMHLTDLDIGGGFPIPSAEGLHVDLAAMLEAINRQLERLFPQTAVWTEPGRFLCGTAMNLVTSVIGTKQRGAVPWYILDEGIYGVFSGIPTTGNTRCTASATERKSRRYSPVRAAMASTCSTVTFPHRSSRLAQMCSSVTSAPTRPSRPRASTASNPPPSSSGKTRPTSSPSAASSVKPMRHPAHRLHRCPDTQRYS